jgi:hypothetical protein
MPTSSFAVFAFICNAKINEKPGQMAPYHRAPTIRLSLIHCDAECLNLGRDTFTAPVLNELLGHTSQLHGRRKMVSFLVTTLFSK